MKTQLTYYSIKGSGHNPVENIAPYISSVFWKEQFNSFFEELNLELCFMADMTDSSMRNKERFKEYYKRLPIARVYRKYKRIEVKLKAPEITKYIEKEYEDRSKNSLFGLKKHVPSVVPERYKNLTHADLARMIIDRYLEAGQLIAPKLKPEDNFDHQRYEQILLRMRDLISDEFLAQMKIPIAEWEKHSHRERGLQARELRKTFKRKKNRLIHAFRILKIKLPHEALSPYDLYYEKIFLDVLRRNKLFCNRFNCLFIFAAANEEDALSLIDKNSSNTGIAIFNYEKYKSLAEKDKKRAVFDIVCRGLRDVVALEKLDNAIVEEAIEEIKATTLNTEVSSKK